MNETTLSAIAIVNGTASEIALPITGAESGLNGSAVPALPLSPIVTVLTTNSCSTLGNLILSPAFSLSRCAELLISSILPPVALVKVKFAAAFI